MLSILYLFFVRLFFSNIQYCKVLFSSIKKLKKNKKKQYKRFDFEYIASVSWLKIVCLDQFVREKFRHCYFRFTLALRASWVRKHGGIWVYTPWENVMDELGI